MSFEKIIKNKIKDLNKKYNELIKSEKTFKYKNQIENIELFLNNLKEEFILELDDNLLSEIFGYLFKRDKEKNLSLFKDIKLIMEAKYLNGITIELSETQKKYLDTLKEKFIEEKSNIKNKIEETTTNYTSNERNNLELNILELEELYEKVIDTKEKKQLTKEDFILLYENIIEDENIDYETKKELLIGFKKYNENMEFKKIVSIDSFVDLLKKYNLKSLEKIATNENNKDLINARLDLEECEKIIDFFQQKDWLQRFSNETLFTILIYGEIENIKYYAQKVENKEKYFDLFFDTCPSFWINNIKRREVKKSKPKEEGSKIKNNEFVTAANEISYEEFLENEKFLLSLGFDLETQIKQNIKTLKTPNYKLIENYEYYKLYKILDDKNIKKFPLSALAFSRVDDKCDNFIEVGLSHGRENYVRKSPTCINAYDDYILQVLYKVKRDVSEENYYNLIMSERQKGSVKSDVRRTKMGFDFKTEDEKEQFLKENYIDNMKALPNATTYEDIIFKNISSEINPNILFEEEIINLENYKANEYIYNFGNQLISRYKVLRCATALKKANINITKETLLYSIIRNSYLDEKTFNEIAKCIGYDLGVIYK